MPELNRYFPACCSNCRQQFGDFGGKCKETWRLADVLMRPNPFSSFPEAAQSDDLRAPVDDLSHVRGATTPSLVELTVDQLLRDAVRRYADAPALVFCETGQRLSWRQLAEGADRLAAALLALGVQHGERVGIWSPNRLEWVLTQFATARIGAVLVNINPAYRLAELEYALNKVEVCVVISAQRHKGSDYFGMLRQLAPELDNPGAGRLQAQRLPHLRFVIGLGSELPPGILSFDWLCREAPPAQLARLDAIARALKCDDPINIQFTSGTTGSPKGATLTHHNIVNNARFVAMAMHLSNEDRLCVPVPLYHCFGMVLGVLAATSVGATLVFPGEGFDAGQTLQAVNDERCTALHGVPTMFIAMLEHERFTQFDLASLRTGIMAGAPCPIETMRRVVSEMHMNEVTIAYGMTETSPVSFQSSTDDPLELRVGTVGRVLPHLEAKIIDAAGHTVPLGEPGELCTRGYSVMKGYWGDEARTRETIRDDWMHTGDLATLDSHGYCNIVGRLKDMLIRGGENIYPREIEEFLFRHPKVSAVQVFGVPDAKYGEEICAWIVLKPGQSATDADIKGFCRDQIAHYKVPRHVRFVPELPITVTGKPQKFVMRNTMMKELGLTAQTTAAHEHQAGQENSHSVRDHSRTDPISKSDHRIPMNTAAPFIHARDLLLKLRTDHSAAVRDFRWPELTTFNWALDHFDVLAKDNDAPALWIAGEDGSEVNRSFHELSVRSSQVANHLRGLGVQRGDHVLLMLGNELALWETMLAAIKLGAVLIPATALLTTEDLRDRMERGAVRHVVAASAQAPKFEPLSGNYTRIAVGARVPGWHHYDDTSSAPIGFAPDGPTFATDPLLLYFTSGTTSKPKLVLHTHQSYPVGHLSTMYWLGLQPGDMHLNISSPGWAKHAWSCFFAPWIAGSCIFIYNSARFDAQGLLAAMATHGVTSLCAPPTVWRMLIQEDLAAWRGKLKLREVIGAGEPLNPEIIDQIKNAWGLTLRDGYGQTETTAQIGNAPGQLLKPGSMGRPLPGYRIALLDPNGKEASEGEVCIALSERPLGLMSGYLDGAERNAEAMRDGYYHTGDVASRDADGYITFVGRADDVFKASDYRISPFELESALIEHDAVAEVAIVPSPDPLRLAVPKAYLMLVPGVEPSRELAEAIFAFSRKQLAPYKRVRRIEFVTELPKTISGKIRRVQLRTQELERHATGTRTQGEFFEDDFPNLKQDA